MIFRSKVPRSIEQEAPFLDIFPQKALRYKKKLFIFAPANEKGAIAQLVEQRTENPCVPGSIPGGTTFQKQSECSAVGSALRSGRRGRAFESPHSDKVKGSFLEYSKLPFIIFRLSGRNRNSRTEIYQPIIS